MTPEQRLVELLPMLKALARNMARRKRVQHTGSTAEDLVQIGLLEAWQVLSIAPPGSPPTEGAYLYTAAYRAILRKTFGQGTHQGKPLDNADLFDLADDPKAVAGERSAASYRQVEARVTLEWLERARARKATESMVARKRRRTGSTGVRGELTTRGRPPLRREETRRRLFAAVLAGDAEPRRSGGRPPDEAPDSEPEFVPALAAERGCSQESVRCEIRHIYLQYAEVAQ